MRTHTDITTHLRHPLQRYARMFGVIIVGAVMMSYVIGCKDTLSNASIPDGTLSPSAYLSKAGGLALTQSALDYFRGGVRAFIFSGGLLTDELGVSDTLSPQNNVTLVDSRRSYSTSGSGNADFFRIWGYAHSLRGQARLARGVLAEYAPDVSPAIRGQLYALEGYAEIWLADLFCSGVSLSTLDYNADFTYRPPSTTHEVYEHAVALFDSALALAADSVNVQTLAAVGKGRALLALGLYEDAAAAVASVSINDKYSTPVQFVGWNESSRIAWYITVSDHEGGNGLDYRTSGDPRTKSDTVRVPFLSNYPVRTVYLPKKWSVKTFDDDTEVTVASGVEAALIGAEAALHRGQPEVWLSALNTLRTTGTYSRIDTAASGEIDTLWNAGSGGVAGLRPLKDPMDAKLRVDLLFAERAAWLFLTGHRQGDLRRLIREYGRAQRTVYPSGVFLTGEVPGFYQYDADITFPIPASEKMNPYYRGCLSRDA